MKGVAWGLTECCGPIALARQEEQVLKRTITQTRLQADTAEILDAVRGQGEFIVVEDPGREGVALVPLHVLESYERSRDRAATLMEEEALSAGLAPDEAAQIAQEEVAAYRAEKRKDAGPESRQTG